MSSAVVVFLVKSMLLMATEQRFCCRDVSFVVVNYTLLSVFFWFYYVYIIAYLFAPKQNFAKFSMNLAGVGYNFCGEVTREDHDLKQPTSRNGRTMGG